MDGRLTTSDGVAIFGGIRLPRVLRAMVECIAAVTLAEICLFGTNKDGNVTET